MAVTETETISYGSRLGGSIKGMLGGLLVFIAAFPLLFWNEGRAVKTARALDEGEGACISVESNKTVDSENEGKFVHMTGKADTKEVLTDDVFGVSENCIGLTRNVEIYQWVEISETKEKKNLGGSVTKTTTYSYKKQWCSSPVDSSGFKEAGHENPGGMEFSDASWSAGEVSFGAFRLSEKQIGMIGGSKTYVFPASFTSKVSRVQMAGNVIYVPVAETRNNPLNNRDVASQTRPGDMRVTYRIIKPHDISIIAKQHGETFVSYKAKNGKMLNLLSDGISEAAEMFEGERNSNAVLTWFLRFVGLMMMCGGIKSILKPLSVLADVLPILGDILDVGIGIVASIIGFVFTVITIAIAWIFYRPVLGIILLLIAGAAIYLLWKKRAAIRTKAASAADKLKTAAQTAGELKDSTEK